MSGACERLFRFLEEQGVEYDLMEFRGRPWRHATPFSYVMTHTYMLAIDSEYALAALSADAAFDLDLLTDELATRVPVRIASDDEVRCVCPGWHREALPPIGSLFGLLVYVSEDLAQEEWIGFPAGDGKRLVYMRYSEFDHLVKPCEVPLCTKDLLPRYESASDHAVFPALL